VPHQKPKLAAGIQRAALVSQHKPQTYKMLLDDSDDDDDADNVVSAASQVRMLPIFHVLYAAHSLH